MLYVNEKGEQTNNNTLYVALHNRQFQKALEGDTKALVEAATSSYADLESVSDDDKEVAVLMGINGYFNLLPDSTPNYSNPDSTIERNEFMAMLYRANTPVKELTEDTSFSGMVGDNKYNIYAQGALSSSYLDTISKSLDNLTYNGTITRAEAVYAVVQTYFADEYKNVDINASTYSDCKNGGNIAQSAIDKTKKANSLSEVDHWKSYELTYALQNPDTVGMPIDLYKAMIVAKQKSLIDGGTSRWDEGLTKSEAIDIIVRAIKQDDSMETFDVIRAEITVKSDLDEYMEELAESLETAEKVEIDESKVENAVGEVDIEEYKAGDADENTYTVTDLDETMYATQKCNIRVQPSIQDDVIGSLLQTQEIHVTGKVNEVDWYRVSLSDGVEGYISASLLTTMKPTVQVTPSAPSSETVTPSDGIVHEDQIINPVTGQTLKPGDTTPAGTTYLGEVITSEDGNTKIMPDGTVIHKVNK